MKPYQAQPQHVLERLEIAILCAETFVLHWADECGDGAHMSKVRPLAVIDRDGRLYLKAETDEQETVSIRLDLIRNLPTPTK